MPRSKLNVTIATRQPSFSSPTRLTTGTRTSSKNVSQNSLESTTVRIGRASMPGEVHRADQPRDATMLGRIGVRAHEQLAVVGDVRERCPDLLTGHDVVIAIADGAVDNDARSLPALGSLNPWHHTSVPLRMRGRCSPFCSAVASMMSVGPACSWPTKCVSAFGAQPLRFFEIDEVLGGCGAAATELFGPVDARVARFVQHAAPLGVELAARPVVVFGWSRGQGRQYRMQPLDQLVAKRGLGRTETQIHVPPRFALGRSVPAPGSARW